MNNDREAISLAVKTVVRVAPRDCRIVRIRNTLDLGEIEVSEPLLAEVGRNPERFQIVSAPRHLAFDSEGNLPQPASRRNPLSHAVGMK
jgi:hypothetical protein